MAKKIVTCDVCGIEMDSEEANFDISTDQDLCNEHFRQLQLDYARIERNELSTWLETTHLKKLRELDERIAELERPNLNETIPGAI